MKINELANEILKEAFIQYEKSKNRLIQSEPIYDKFNFLEEEIINDAFRSLASDNLITSRWADNKVWIFELNIDTIKDKEEYSRLKKIYVVLKEFRDWIPGY